MIRVRPNPHSAASAAGAVVASRQGSRSLAAPVVISFASLNDAGGGGASRHLLLQNGFGISRGWLGGQSGQVYDAVKFSVAGGGVA